MRRTNQQASINPVNLVALAITRRNHLTLQEHTLFNRIECYRTLVLALFGDGILTENADGAERVIGQASALALFDRDPEEEKRGLAVHLVLLPCSHGTAITFYTCLLYPR